jgi:uncharacterized membrane protein (DUF373 family)
LTVHAAAHAPSPRRQARGIALDAPHTGVHRISRRFLEPAQDVLVLALGLVLFALMARTLVGMVGELLTPAIDIRTVIAEVLFILLMVELVRLLVIYLQEHRVAVDFMVELGMVATLREIVLRGVVDLPWELIVALSLFLLTLGVLLRFGDLRSPDTSADGHVGPQAVGVADGRVPAGPGTG